MKKVVCARVFDAGSARVRCALVGWISVWLGLSAAGVALAQPSPRDRNPGREHFERLVFPPELVMSHQAEIGLTPEQKQALVQEMQSAQSDLVPLQLEMAEVGERLSELLTETRVEEGATLETAQRVMRLESEVKTRHLLLVIRIKNLLTAEQQAALRRIRDHVEAGG